MISTSPVHQLHIQKQDSEDNQVLLFVKKFVVIPNMDDPELAPELRLQMLTPILINRDTKFDQAIESVKEYVEEDLEGTEVVIEMFQRPGPSPEEWDILDRDRNHDGMQGFMRTTEHHRVSLNALSDGTILIFVKEDYLWYLDEYLKEKANELWLLMA